MRSLKFFGCCLLLLAFGLSSSAVHAAASGNAEESVEKNADLNVFDQNVEVKLPGEVMINDPDWVCRRRRHNRRMLDQIVDCHQFDDNHIDLSGIEKGDIVDSDSGDTVESTGGSLSKPYIYIPTA